MEGSITAESPNHEIRLPQHLLELEVDAGGRRRGISPSEASIHQLDLNEAFDSIQVAQQLNVEHSKTERSQCTNTYNRTGV